MFKSCYLIFILNVIFVFPHNPECGKKNEMYLCADKHTCVRNLALCPNFDNFKCSDPLLGCDGFPGVCVADKKDCPTQIVCSDPTLLLCWNGVCDANCPEYIECPAYMPYKCSNGECRSSLFDCPQAKVCPNNANFQCVDGSCRTNREQCQYAESLMRTTTSLIKCPDGRLMASYSLCGTQRTCPIGYIKCWTGSCVTSASQCDVLCPEDAPFVNKDGSCSSVYRPTFAKCNESSAAFYCDGNCKASNKECYRGVVCSVKSVMCYDGSCRSRYEDCPTETVCPIEKPVKCYDGSCATSIINCPPLTECSSFAKRCPNGQCVVNTASCGTGITCRETSPIKCYDNTCRRDSSECPVVPSCPSNRTYLCSDGSCQRSPEQCYPETQCNGYQIKCPDFSCVNSITECRELRGCPPGMYPCPDKSCRPSFQLCPPDTCPKAMPHKCLDGMCVQDEKECNSPSTACPRNSPLKCSDGSCVARISDCTKGLILNIADDMFLCPDGSLSDNIDTCYSVYGCPNDFPFMCYDGTCIDLNRQSCSVATCPITSPYRCTDGQCVESKSMCRSFIGQNECAAGMVACADGRCMTKAEFCRPLMPCGYGFVRCADGSCRRDLSMCPISLKMKCPANRPYRCSNGACVPTAITCMTTSVMTGCPLKKCTEISDDKAQFFGRCVASQSECPISDGNIVVYTGCIKSKPYRCPDGSCVVDSKLCETVISTVCESTKFKCDDKKTCVTKNTECADNSACRLNYQNCFTAFNCPINKPFMCANGDCAAISFYPFGIITNATYCLPKPICPSTMPFMCDDGSCQSYPERCSPSSLKYRCGNGEPSVDGQDCATKVGRCPPLRPILCASGVCVARVQECVKIEHLCPKTAPIRCANGVCVAYYGDCMPTADYKAPINDTDYRCPNKGLSFVCPDGSCALDSQYCIAIVNACNDPEKPVKCKTGTCAESAVACEASEKSMPTCASNYRLCEDGICRKKCPDYNGCPLKRPVQCPNGYCAADIGQCAGISDCPLERPFSCYNRVCVKSFRDCAPHPRSEKPYTVMITIDSQQETDADIIVNGTGFVLGKLYIPSNTLGYIDSNTSYFVYVV